MRILEVIPSSYDDNMNHIDYGSPETVLDFGLRSGVANARNFVYFCPPDLAQRREFQGPKVQGPWATLSGLAGCISADPETGTYGEIKRNKAANREHDVAVGDRIFVQGFLFEIVPNPSAYQKGFPVLKLIDKKRR